MSRPVDVLARKVFEEYSRAGGNPPDAHFDRNAAEQWMADALEFAGVAELIEAAETLTNLADAASTEGRFADGMGDELDALEAAQAALALTRVRGAA